MNEETTYGLEFVDHLRAISRQSHFSYSDLQAIKAMNQEQLGAHLATISYDAGNLIRNNPAKDAAELMYKKQLECSQSNPSADNLEGSVILLEVLCSLFAASQ